MKKFIFILVLIAGISSDAGALSPRFFEADHPYLQYTGRIDFSNPKTPRFWTAGVYIKAKFKGTFCEIEIRDEMLWGNMHNYLEISIDGAEPLRIRTTGKNNVIRVADGLPAGEHTIIISKGTEALIGYIEFIGLRCEELIPLPDKPLRKIEFIGDSITSGMGSDTQAIPCDSGQWYDQHSAWFSYGALTARALNAQYHLTSESGIGLIHNCCNKPFTMPRVFNKVSLSKDSIVWDFSRYQPDVVTVCLGQNDGVQDSIQFTVAYSKFVKELRTKYPKAYLICLISPMADATLKPVLERYAKAVTESMKDQGEKRFSMFSFSKTFTNGCGHHPDVNDHRMLSVELKAYIAGVMNWN